VDASGREQALESSNKISCVVSQVLFHDRVVLMFDQMSIKNDFTNWYWKIATS
jgi:hypothetical protein